MTARLATKSSTEVSETIERLQEALVWGGVALVQEVGSVEETVKVLRGSEGRA